MIRQISAGRMNVKAESVGNNEISILGDALNEMSEALSDRNRELSDERRELQDVNAQLKENQAGLIEALAAAETANRSKTEFLATMSHELRTPLNAVIGFSEVLTLETIGNLNEKQKDRIGLIKESGIHLLSLINDILDVSKIEAGKFEPHFEMVDAKEELLKSVRFVENRAELAEVKITANLPDDLSPIRADRRLFTQIFINLLSNAINFTLPGGSIDLSVSRTADDGLVFQVADTGIGIAEKNLSEITKPFVQVDSVAHNTRQGTGLGLYLVSMYTSLHNWELDIKSTVEQGTVASIRIPGPSEQLTS